MASIELKNLAHSYASAPRDQGDYALKPLNVTFGDGDALALLGPSGCGKTTLLNIISGLITPTQGTVLFDGDDVTDRPPEARNIAQVFQFPVIYDTMSVYENLAFPLKNRRVEKSAIDDRIRRVAQMLELSDCLENPAIALPADQKQKLSLGRGLVRDDAAAILFDEPLTVIDPELKWLLRTRLKQAHADFSHTMIYVTHDQTEALTFADRVIVMRDGEILQIGSPAELFERPAHSFVGHFIGSPGMNLLRCTLESGNVSIAGHNVSLPYAFDAPAVRADINLGVRPEFVKISECKDGLPATLDRVEDTGRRKIARLRVADMPVAAVLPEDASPIPAQPRLSIETEHAHLYADEYLVSRKP